jgi:hypothetical protein
MSAASDRRKAYEEFLARFLADNPTVQPITSSDPAEIGEFVVRNAPPGSGRMWLGDLMALSAPPAAATRYGVLALAVGGAIVAVALLYGIFFREDFLPLLAEEGNARGLITFLFAVATIAVILITVIATFWVSAEEVEKRGTIAREILTLLIGIMGTILGFYFGSAAPEPAPPATPPPVVAPAG